MDEHVLMQDLMRQILELAALEEGKAVTAIEVKLSGMTAERFTARFEELSAGTIADGAELSIVPSDAGDSGANGIVLQSISIDA